MATTAHWIEGARLRTLPAAVSPVLVGSGAAAYVHGFVWWKALLALVVALALQVGVNFANDYSDGIRGTDAERVGPLRLVGSGVASPRAVKAAAFGCFAVAGGCGLVLAATTTWWLVAVGVAAVLAAWFYTGGSRPYGYRALGEVSVFVFFGLVAVIGTTYVQAETVPAVSVLGAVASGALACAILVANNLRDIPSDEAVGKRTLAVVLGDRRTRDLFVGLPAAAFGLAAVTALTQTWWALLAFAALPFGWTATAAVGRGESGTALIRVLKLTGLTELIFAVGLAAGLVIGACG